MKRLILNILVLSIAILLSGCAAAVLEGIAIETAVAEVGAVETIAAAESVAAADAALATRAGLAIAAETGELSIVSETSFMRHLARVKVDRAVVAENPKLYIIENGVRNNFGILKNNRIIQINRLNKQLVIEGELYRVKGNNVNIRTGKGMNYDVYKVKNTDDLVMVVEKDYKWLKVKTGNNEFGYISSALVTPATNKGTAGTPDNKIENQDKYYFVEKTVEQINIKTNSPNKKEISCIVFNEDNIYNQKVTSAFIEGFKNKGYQIVSNSSINYPSILTNPDVIIYSEKINNKTDFIAVGTYSENTFENNSGTIYKFSTSATLNYRIINTKTLEEYAYSLSANGIGLNEIESKNSALKKLLKDLKP